MLCFVCMPVLFKFCLIWWVPINNLINQLNCFFFCVLLLVCLYSHENMPILYDINVTIWQIILCPVPNHHKTCAKAAARSSCWLWRRFFFSYPFFYDCSQVLRSGEPLGQSFLKRSMWCALISTCVDKELLYGSLTWRKVSLALLTSQNLFGVNNIFYQYI